ESRGRQPERLPEAARSVEVGSRQRDLELLAADGDVVSVPIAGRKRSRLDELDFLATRIDERDGVELVVAQVLVSELDAEPAKRAHVVAKPGAHEREPRPRLRAGVEPDGNAAVEADDVRVGQRVADGDARETQRLEELERICERPRRDGILEKLTEHRRPESPQRETWAGHSGRLRRAAPTSILTDHALKHSP